MLRRDFVSTTRGFIAEVIDLCIEHALRWERHAGVIEMYLPERGITAGGRCSRLVDLCIGERTRAHDSWSTASIKAFSTTSVSAGCMYITSRAKAAAG